MMTIIRCNYDQLVNLDVSDGCTSKNYLGLNGAKKLSGCDHCGYTQIRYIAKLAFFRANLFSLTEKKTAPFFLNDSHDTIRYVCFRSEVLISI